MNTLLNLVFFNEFLDECITKCLVKLNIIWYYFEIFGIFSKYLVMHQIWGPSHAIICTVQYSCVQYIYGTRGGCDPPAAFPRKCRKTQLPNIRDFAGHLLTFP
jgi:hypothetical protein